MNDEADPFARHRSSLGAGIDLFNRHAFWEAHEAWERAWLELSGEPRTFLQGLIQLAAAYHHVQRGTYGGGARLFDAALTKLSRFGDGYGGVDRDAAVAAATLHRKKIARGDHIDAEELPKLRYN